MALSTTAADLGTTSLVTLVVFAAKPLPPEAAALSGLLALGGALLQTGLALAGPLASLYTNWRAWWRRPWKCTKLLRRARRAYRRRRHWGRWWITPSTPLVRSAWLSSMR
ncbi:MAG TPA: hypothetical protein VMR62_28305 [Bryobacteraceae bacterium]|nr:hypothetical protein [Bryobacteraceae bacterium]